MWHEVGLTIFGQKIAYTELVGQVLALAVVFLAQRRSLLTSWAPWPDAAIFVGTILAFALQGLGLVEFWLVWLVVDAVGVPLQIQSGLYFSAFVYIIFAGLVIHGFIDWNRTARRLTQAAKSPL